MKDSLWKTGDLVRLDTAASVRLAFVVASPAPVFRDQDTDSALVFVLAMPWAGGVQPSLSQVLNSPLLLPPRFVSGATMTASTSSQYVRHSASRPHECPARLCFLVGLPGKRFADEYGNRYSECFWPVVNAPICRVEGLIHIASEWTRVFTASGGTFDEVMRMGGGSYQTALYTLNPPVRSPDSFPPAPEYSPPRHPTGTLIKLNLNKTTSLLGRVIRDDANLWGLGDDYLLYIYKPECKPTPKCKVPGLEHLLLPPMIISDEGWRFGKFKTLRVEPVGPAESLPRHLFASSTSSTGYVDHTGAEAAKPAATPQLHIGTWEHTFVSMITERAAAALGVPAEAPAPPPPPAVRPGVTLYIDMESGVADTPLDRGDIADELADALGDLAELGDEGTNLATGEMEIEFDGTKVAAIEKKILSTLKRMGITKGVRVVSRGGKRQRG